MEIKTPFAPEYSPLQELVSETAAYHIVLTEEPYVTYLVTKVFKYYQYNPLYGDDRKCKCGHPYYRHFDSYDCNHPVGCKYCICYTFEEKIND